MNASRACSTGAAPRMVISCMTSPGCPPGQPGCPLGETSSSPREARRPYAAIGLDVPDSRERLRCYELTIGLGGQAYCAFKQRWNESRGIAERTLALDRAPLTS